MFESAPPFGKGNLAEERLERTLARGGQQIKLSFRGKEDDLDRTAQVKISVKKDNIGLVVIQKFVSETPSLLHILSVQALAYAFFGVVGQMHRAMKPPRPVIIPQVMVRIITVQPDGQVLISHFLTKYFSTKYTSGHSPFRC